MNEIKIAHVSTVPFSLRYLCLSLLRDLKKDGYEVFTVSSSGGEVSALEKAGIRHVPVEMTRSISPFADLRALWRLYKIFRRERVEIVHTHTPKANLLGQLAARLARVPVRVSTVHGLYFTSDTPAVKRTIFHIVESWSAKFADTVFLVNREDVETVRKRRLCLPSKMRLLANGIGASLQKFNPDMIKSTLLKQTRASLGLSEDCRVVGFVGRLVAEKGLLELLKAARAFREWQYPIRFLIVGPSDDDRCDAVNAETATSYDVSDLCLFTGARDDMPVLYGLMDVLVLPSHREGCPRVVMEASAMGLPCIVTDVRGCRDVVQHGRTGLIVPKGDVAELTVAIHRLLTDPIESRRMGNAARRLALERFDERPVFERIKQEYARLLRERGVQAPEPTATPLLEVVN